MFQIYTTFYCRINEPSYIKHLKLDILAAIADETNAYDIATELTEYVNDIDEKLARKAIRTVGKIALEVNHAARMWHGTTLRMSCLATAAVWTYLAGHNLLKPIHTMHSGCLLHTCCMAILLSPSHSVAWLSMSGGMSVHRCKMCQAWWNGCWDSWTLGRTL